MFESVSLKMIEAGALLVAGVAFAWWQLADIKKAQAASAKAKQQAEQHNDGKPTNP
jgi:hypothetical protein